MLRAMSFAQWKNSSKFDELVVWATNLLNTDTREHLVSIVVLDDDGRPDICLADLERNEAGIPEFTMIHKREVINRYSE